MKREKVAPIERDAMEGKEDEMKQRRESLMNMCRAQLLFWCLPAVLELLRLSCGHRSRKRSGKS